MSTPAYISDCLAVLLPPETLTVSEWAAKYRRLDSMTSAMPGPWRNDTTPYLVGIMDEFTNPETEEIVFCKPTQVGGTEALLNMLGYVISNDPAPSMVVYPTDDLGAEISEKKLQPMFRITPPIAAKFDARSADMELGFSDMFLRIAGSNSPSQLASFAERNLFLDEVDKFAGATAKEADALSLAEERTKTFANSKIYKTSTPTIRTGPIWKAKEAADIEKHYFVPCPHCGEMIELRFKQLRWPGEEAGSYADRAEFASYCCQECGCAITDAQKREAVRHGEWRIVRQNTQYCRSVAFWMNTLYSPFVRFADIAKKFLASKDDPELLQNFVNSWLAEPWEDTKLKTDEDLVLEHQTDVAPYVVPEWAKLITAGVDVQEQSLYWTIRAWGDYMTSQNIAHGQAYSWQEVESVMNVEYAKADGDRMVVQLCLVDSGNDTDSVYDFCAENSDWALPVKGSSNPMLTHYKVSSVNRADSRAHGMQLIIVDGGKYKDMIAGRLMKPVGRGAWMVYKDCDEEYAKQVTAEHKVNVKGGAGKVLQRWVPKASHADNHYLDTEVYAMAAADLLGVRYLHLQEQAESTGRQQPKQSRQQQPLPPEENWIDKNERWI
jgi:phage terminase large subunit GpA-like protein